MRSTFYFFFSRLCHVRLKEILKWINKLVTRFKCFVWSRANVQPSCEQRNLATIILSHTSLKNDCPIKFDVSRLNLNKKYHLQKFSVSFALVCVVCKSGNNRCFTNSINIQMALCKQLKVLLKILRKLCTLSLMEVILQISAISTPLLHL